VYTERGDFAVPIPPDEKGPDILQWQKLRLGLPDLPRYFNGSRQNLGLILGLNNLTDIDLDAPEAQWTWGEFAPETGMVFGRKSKPASHYFYRTDGKLKLRQYLDPTRKGDGAMLLELRSYTTQGEIGLQTVVPPSTHPSGERIEFFNGLHGEPGNIAAEDLLKAAQRAAAAALLGRYAPPQGVRHAFFLTLSGALAHAGWGLPEASRVVYAVYKVLWQSSADLRNADQEIESTFRRYDDGKEITGLPGLKVLLDERVFKTVVKWLELGREEQVPPPRAVEERPEVPPPTRPPKAPPKPVFTYRDVPSVWEGDDEIRYIIPDLLPEGAITLITGDSGHGKSVLALALAGAISWGRPFLERQAERRMVIYLDRENSKALIKKRLSDLHIPENPEWLIYWGGWVEQQADGPASVSLLEAAHKEKPVLIFDSLIAFHTGDEQSASETRRYLHYFRRLAHAGATVIILHHIGKGENAKQYRGSTDIKAGMDVAWLLEKLGDNPAGLLEQLRLVPFKNRIGISETISLCFRDGVFMFSGARAPSHREILEGILRNHPNAKATEVRDLGMAAGLKKHRVEGLLTDGVQQGWIQIQSGPRRAQYYSLVKQPDLDGI
jgi:archaellum biogenesis ATPase FlaH